MSLLEALTMTSGLVYLVLLLWQGRSGWGWTLSLLLAAALWLLVADSVLWLSYSPRSRFFFLSRIWTIPCGGDVCRKRSTA